MLPLLSIRANTIKSDITNLPIDLSFWSYFNARHTMTTKTNVNSVTM